MNRDIIKQFAKQADFSFWEEDEWWGEPGEIDWSCNYDKEFHTIIELILQDVLNIAAPKGDKRSEIFRTRKIICDTVKEKYGLGINDNIIAGAEIHADKGYEIGTQEGYEEFMKKRK